MSNLGTGNNPGQPPKPLEPPPPEDGHSPGLPPRAYKARQLELRGHPATLPPAPLNLPGLSESRPPAPPPPCRRSQQIELRPAHPRARPLRSTCWHPPPRRPPARPAPAITEFDEFSITVIDGSAPARPPARSSLRLRSRAPAAPPLRSTCCSSPPSPTETSARSLSRRPPSHPAQPALQAPQNPRPNHPPVIPFRRRPRSPRSAANPTLAGKKTKPSFVFAPSRPQRGETRRLNTAQPTAAYGFWLRRPAGQTTDQNMSFGQSACLCRPCPVRVSSVFVRVRPFAHPPTSARPLPATD